ncbi:MAG: phytanoyl-CoA dioxygenase family protein [Chloroflexota bacterium]
MSIQDTIQQYNKLGYAVVSGLFAQSEIDFFKGHYEAMRQRESQAMNPNDGEAKLVAEDPLIAYPRLMQPHYRDESSLQWLLDERLNHYLTALLGREPFAVQTMFYFKPPGARGQALHQDQFYLRVQPGTCMAAWMAIDDCDEENGCIRVVPGSQNWPLLCMTEADTTQSFTDVTVPIPEDTLIEPILMKAGDVLFFNGQIVHGSLPNRTSDRFRRALIGHYLVGEAKEVYKWYHPILQMDGSQVELGTSEAGGTCGTWVQQDGKPQLELQAEQVNQKIFG